MKINFKKKQKKYKTRSCFPKKSLLKSFTVKLCKKKKNYFRFGILFSRKKQRCNQNSIFFLGMSFLFLTFPLKNLSVQKTEKDTNLFRGLNTARFVLINNKSTSLFSFFLSQGIIPLLKRHGPSSYIFPFFNLKLDALKRERRDGRANGMCVYKTREVSEWKRICCFFFFREFHTEAYHLRMYIRCFLFFFVISMGKIHTQPCLFFFVHICDP